MKRRHLAIYFLLLIISGFCVGNIYSANIVSMEALSGFSGLISASASLFTAWIALSALNSWRIQEKYKKHVELSMQAFELLSELKCSSKIYADQLIRVRHNNLDENKYFENTRPFVEQLKEYSRIYARIEFLGLLPSMSRFVSVDALNDKIKQLVFDEIQKENEIAAIRTKNAQDNIDSFFDDLLNAIKTFSPIDKINRS